jgi:antitoxin CptB
MNRRAPGNIAVGSGPAAGWPATSDLRCAREPERVRWRCRRGLLELDLILARFLDHRYDALGPEERALFEELLEHSDNDLLDLALGRCEPAPRHRTLVRMLREV